MRTTNEAIRRELTGTMPTGENKLAGKTFRVIHHKPETALPTVDLLEGFTLFMNDGEFPVMVNGVEVPPGEARAFRRAS